MTSAGSDHGSERLDWERRIGRRTTSGVLEAAAELPAPAGLVAVPGRGHVTLNWSPVAGAAGYIIYRGKGEEGEFAPLDHGGSDVLAVPSGPYADTTIQPASLYRYTVAATTAPDAEPGPRCEEVVVAVPAKSLQAVGAPEVSVNVRADNVTAKLERIWYLVGSERFAQLRFGGNGHGQHIGDEVRASLRQARAEIGTRSVRAHGIFHDELGVYRLDADGTAVYDFSQVQQVLDSLVETGVEPVIELSFMPKDLASDPEATVFQWHGIISPPSDWRAWAELNRRLAEHLVGHYGIDTVARWAFEVWNEANLEVFWTGTQEEYFRLYAEAATAVKSVDPRLRVGGPATAATEWIEAFCAYVADNDLPLDFISTHTYGNLPLDLRPILERHGLQHAEIWWTEWGVGSTHFGPIHDTPFGAPFVLRGLKASQSRLDALAYWVLSDHFEELGRPPRLFHNGFGLLSVGNLRKPRYWAMRLANEMGDDLLSCDIGGDGAVSVVDAWAATTPGGVIDVLVWSSTPNASQFAGRTDLDRSVAVTVTGLAPGRYRASLARVDGSHSNITRHLPPDVDWPDERQWRALRSADRLYEVALADVTAESAHFRIALPMPGVFRLRLSPASTQDTPTQGE